MTSSPQRGFTLIEVMVTVAIVAILAGIALPSYSSYMRRSKVPVALDNLSALSVRMEQCYQDTGTYTGCRPCTTAGLPTPANFTVTCAISGSGTTTTFTATATGSSTMAGYAYTINSAGVRATTAHPKGGNSTCWTTRGTTCDT